MESRRILWREQKTGLLHGDCPARSASNQEKPAIRDIVSPRFSNQDTPLTHRD